MLSAALALYALTFGPASLLILLSLAPRRRAVLRSLPRHQAPQGIAVHVPLAPPPPLLRRRRRPCQPLPRLLTCGGAP